VKKNLALVFFIVLLSVSIFALVKYINFSKNYTTSNAVFVKTDSLTNLSFKIPGKIEKIYVNEGDSVKEGKILAKLDTKDLEIKKNELLSQIKALKNKIQANVIQKEKLNKDIDENIKLINSQIKKIDKLIDSKKYAIKSKENKLEKLKNDYKRFSRLYKNRKISFEKYENE
jgi:membrane fusion protein (multidrug efflux system)